MKSFIIFALKLVLFFMYMAFIFASAGAATAYLKAPAGLVFGILAGVFGFFALGYPLSLLEKFEEES